MQFVCKFPLSVWTCSASRLVCSTPFQVDWATCIPVRAQAGSILLCFWARHLLLQSLPPSRYTQIMGTNKFNVGEKLCKALVYAYPYAAAYLTSVNQALLCTRALTWTVKSRMVLWSPASGIFLLLTSKEWRLARTFSKLLVLGLCFKAKHFDQHFTSLLFIMPGGW